MNGQLRLVEFQPGHFEQLINWIPDEDFLLLWGGPLYRWPLTVEQLQRHLAADDVTPLLLLDGEQAVGFCELIRESSAQYRLCRVLIGSPSSRGRGLGKRLLELVLDYARREFSASRFSLHVFADNHAAIRCYQAFQFREVSRDQHGVLADGTPRIVLRMESEIG